VPITPPIPTCNGAPFLGWTGTGRGSYTGPTPHAQVTMDSNILEVANYGTTTIPPISAINMSVGENITSGPWTIQLQDLGQPVSGTSPALVTVYYNTPTNQGHETSSMLPGTTTGFSIGGATLNLDLIQTFNGLYSWAEIYPWYLPAAVLNIGQNTISGPWTVELLDIGPPINGINGVPVSGATFAVYYQGTLEGTFAVNPGTLSTFEYNGHLLYLNLSSTTYGLYAYQKSASMQLWYVPPTITPPTQRNAINMSVGENITSGPWTIQLQNIDASSQYTSYLNSAAFNIYYNGIPTNVIDFIPGTTATVDVNGQVLNINLAQTFDGLYAYQKWAEIYPWYGFAQVYVGHNITSGPWTVQLVDLGQPNTNGISAASVEVWYNGVLTNQSQVTPDSIATFEVNGNLMYLEVNQTFSGLYAYQKWAKMQLWYVPSTSTNSSPLSYIYCVNDISPYGTSPATHYASVSGTNVGAWTQTTPYPILGDGSDSVSPSCVLSNGYIYCVGGGMGRTSHVPTLIANAVYAPVTSTGIGAWTQTTPYPMAAADLDCITSNGYIYCIGGIVPGSATFERYAYSAPLSSTGIGAWTKSTTLYPASLGAPGTVCTASNSDIYCIGGVDTEDNLAYLYSSAYYAPISSGSVGAWTQTTPYPVPIVFNACATSNGYIYCTGGQQEGVYGTTADYYAPLSSSGAIGAWTQTTPYPIRVYSQSCTASNSYIYCIAGTNAAGGVTAVYSAPLSGSGIGNWTESTNNYPEAASATSGILSWGTGDCSVSTPSPSTTTSTSTTSISTTTAPQTSEYLFSALIGSVLNQGVQLDAPQYTKALQSSIPYAFPESTSTNLVTSPYTAEGGAPYISSVAQFNGGGVSFSGVQGSGGYDNLLRISSAQLGSLLNNYGPNGENEYLYLTGFPVYDQQNNIRNFQLLGAGGAYEITFSKPIQNITSTSDLNVPIMLLGQNYKIISGTGALSVQQGIYSPGGSLVLEGPAATTYTLTENHAFPGNPGWNVNMLWTSVSGSMNGDALYGIVIYNSTPTSIAPSQSYSFIENPAAFNVIFLGDTLGAGSFDPVQVSTGWPYTQQYQNLGITISASFPGSTIYNITEPMQPFTVKSSIPNAFTGTGAPSGSLLYDLTPYMLVEEANAVTIPTTTGTPATTVTLNYKDTSLPLGHSNTAWFGTSGSGVGELQATVSGYTLAGKQRITEPAIFQVNTSSAQVVTGANTLPVPLYNVTAIQVNKALPLYSGGRISYTVTTTSGGTSVPLAVLANTITTPALLYLPSNTNEYQYALSISPSALSQQYNQQNGQPTTAFTIAQGSTPATTLTPHQIATYKMQEVAVPPTTNTLALDTIGVGIYNNSITGSPYYIVNYSTSGQGNNVSYTSAEGGNLFAVPVGFRTERGSKVASITPTQDVFEMAENIDQLQFSVQEGQAVSTTNTVSTLSTPTVIINPNPAYVGSPATVGVYWGGGTPPYTVYAAGGLYNTIVTSCASLVGSSGSSYNPVSPNPVTTQTYWTNTGVPSVPGSEYVCYMVADSSHHVAFSTPTAFNVLPATTTTIPTGHLSNPGEVAFNPSGTLAYVVNDGSDTVSVINPSTGTVINTIPVGTSPVGVAFNPSGTLAYVTHCASGTVSVINPSTSTIINTITLGTACPWGIAFNPSGTLAYVTNTYGDTVLVINVATDSVIDTITVGSDPTMVAFNPSGTLAYVTNEYTSTISVINGATDSVINTITVGTTPWGVAVNPSGTLLYVTNAAVNGGGTVSVVNPATDRVTSTIAVGTWPFTVAFNPSGTLAYVVNDGSDTVSVINPSTGTVINTVPVGTSPVGVAFNPSGTLAYVTNEGSDTISIINTATGTVTGTIS
jgi:YVTN family beta-propeller protein